MHCLLYPRKEPWYSLNRRQTEPYSHSEHLEKRKIFCPKEKKYFISLRE